jgi:iron complex transport system ATP-binding protein
VLEIEGLNFSYGGRKTLNNINLSAGKGDFIGILGPNGSGKTTLIKIINRILKPSTGSIRINGKDIKSMDHNELATNVAVVSQVFSINFEFTVEDIVLMGRTPYIEKGETAEDIEISRDCMKKTNTYYLKDRFVTRLSGGELQRVVIARALAQQPSILLLDEPTSHLDITNQIDILNLAKNECKKGTLVVAVIHDLNLAAYYCNKICLIRDGEILLQGTPEEVLTKENIHVAYNLPVEILCNPITNSLNVVPLLEPLP